MKPDAVSQQYDAAIEEAARIFRDVQSRLNNAQQRLGEQQTQIPGKPQVDAYGDEHPGPATDNPAYAQVATQIKELEGSLSRAGEQYVILQRQKAEAQSALARDAKSPEEAAKYEADAAQSNAQANYIKAQQAQLGAKTDIDRKQAEAQMASAQASLQNAAAAQQNAQTNAAELTARAPLYAAQATDAAAGANLTSEQAAAKARENRQAPTDAQAATVNQNAVDLGTANVARANQVVDVGNKGTMAGLDQYMQSLHEAQSSGRLSDDQASQMLAARLAATDVYTASKDANTAVENRFQQDVQQRGQDTNLAQTRTSTFGSMGNQGLQTIGNLMLYGKHGSDAGARALREWMDDITGRLGGPTFAAPAQVQQPALPPMLQRFAGPQQQAPAPTMAPPAAPAPPQQPQAPMAPPAPPAPAAPTGDGRPPEGHAPAFVQAMMQSPAQARGPQMEPAPWRGGAPAQMQTAPWGDGAPPQMEPAFIQGKMPVTEDMLIAKYPEAARRLGMRPSAAPQFA